MGTKLSEEVNQELQRKIDSDIPTAQIISYLNSNIKSPSLGHFDLIQMLWVRDHAYFMGLEQHRKIPELEAFRDYRFGNGEKLHKLYHLVYFLRYIQPAHCDVAKRKEFDELPEDDKRWVEDEIDQVNNLRQNSTLVQKVSGLDSETAQEILREGLSAGAV